MSPLNANIPMSGQQQPFNNPFEQLAQQRAQQQQAQIQQQAAQENSQIRQQTITQNQRQAQVEERQAASDESYRQIIGNPDLTPEAIGELVRTKTPEKYDAYVKRLDEQTNAGMARLQAKRDADDATQKWIGGYMDDIAKHDYDPLTTELALKHMEGLDPAFREQAAQIRQQIIDGGGKPAIKAVIDRLRPTRAPVADYTLGEGRFSGATNQMIAQAPVKLEKAPTVGSFEDYVTRGAQAMGKTPAQLSPTDIEGMRKRFQQADDRPVNINMSGMAKLYNDTDPEAIAAGIRRGEMPPDISQYGRPVQGAIASILAKPTKDGQPPFQLANAQRVYASQKRLNATMNGSQQVRLDESIKSGLAMYDKVDEISDKWKGLGLGVLSRANLKAAKEGLKGKEAAAVANELEGQIGQLTSDIATIEQGGLTPTNESRAVAERSMQAWWGDGTIKRMTAQGRTNMRIRETARADQGTFTAGNTDRSGAPVPSVAAPAGAPAPTAGGRIRVRGPNGEKGTVPAGSPLPSGWVRQ